MAPQTSDHSRPGSTAVISQGSLLPSHSGPATRLSFSKNGRVLGAIRIKSHPLPLFPALCLPSGMISYRPSSSRVSDRVHACA
eukprot:1646537-Rhodomonas_salina.1